MSKVIFSIGACVAIATIAAMSGGAFAAEPVTKDEAVAMVKKAVHAIESQGADKAYADISNPSVDRELYIVVCGPDGTILAHGANKARIGTNQINNKDPDGKAFIKERVELAKQSPTFWQSYKFMNPVTKKVEPKQMYCERLDTTTVCGGIYY